VRLFFSGTGLSDIEENMRISHFRSAEEFRAWLRKNHAGASELYVGLYKKSSGQAGMTYPEALDEALCFGWIDGVRKNVDAKRYTIRFSPRKPKSNWSLVNIRRVRELIALKRMHPTGLRAFESRDERLSKRYWYERKTSKLSPVFAKQFKANVTAWAFFSAQARSYQRVASWWVISAKQEETRQRRLQALIRDSAAGRRVGQFVSSKKGS
jgi:uncharacterized protein YdeI (YjbR/CyaY-like superfamily)